MTFKLFNSLNWGFLIVCAAANILLLAWLLPGAKAATDGLWAVVALIPLDLALVLAFSVAADRKYASVAQTLSRELDPAGFRRANAPVLKRLEAHPELNHTRVGFAVRMNEAVALAETGKIHAAVERLKSVLYDPAAGSEKNKRVYARALLYMARMLYCQGEPEGAGQCLEELKKLRDGLAEQDGARKSLGQLLLRGEAARAAYEGRWEESLKLLREIGDGGETRLEQVRLTCLAAYAGCLSGDEAGGQAALDDLGPQAQGLFACAETRRRCGLDPRGEGEG